MKNFPRFYIIISIIAVICLIATMIVPEIGKYSLLKEVFLAIVLLSFEIVFIKVFILVIKSSKLTNIILPFIVVLSIGFVIGSKSIHIAKDVVSGPEEMLLTNCEVERRRSSIGFFSLGYYLIGSDSDGNEYRFDISGEAYAELKKTKDLIVWCYKNSERIIKYK